MGSSGPAIGMNAVSGAVEDAKAEADADDEAEDQGDQQRGTESHDHLGEGVDDAHVLEQGDVGDHAGHQRHGGPGDTADESLVP